MPKTKRHPLPSAADLGIDSTAVADDDADTTGEPAPEPKSKSPPTPAPEPKSKSPPTQPPEEKPVQVEVSQLTLDIPFVRQIEDDTRDIFTQNRGANPGELSRDQIRKLQQIRAACVLRGEKLANGTEVTRVSHIIKWILDQLKI